MPKMAGKGPEQIARPRATLLAPGPTAGKSGASPRPLTSPITQSRAPANVPRRASPAPSPAPRKAGRPAPQVKHAGTSSQASRQPLRQAWYVRIWPAAAVLRKMADRRRQRASQDTEDEESGASGSDSGGSPARGGGSCSGSAGGGGSGSLPSQRGGRTGALHLRRVESGGAKSPEESECVSARGRGGPGAGCRW